VRIAEEVLGRPATILEIYVTLEDTYGKSLNNAYELLAILHSILREDLIYVDEFCQRITLNKKDGFYSYSEIFRAKFPQGYGCDKIGRVVPTTAKRINLRQLMEFLTSSNE